MVYFNARMLKKRKLQHAVQLCSALILKSGVRDWSAATVAVTSRRQRIDSASRALQSQRMLRRLKHTVAVWRCEVVGWARVLNAFRKLVLLRHTKRLCLLAMSRLACFMQNACIKKRMASISQKFAQARENRVSRRATALVLVAWQQLVWHAQHQQAATAAVCLRVRQLHLWRQLEACASKRERDFELTLQPTVVMHRRCTILRRHWVSLRCYGSWTETKRRALAEVWAGRCHRVCCQIIQAWWCCRCEAIDSRRAIERAGWHRKKTLVSKHMAQWRSEALVIKGRSDAKERAYFLYVHRSSLRQLRRWQSAVELTRVMINLERQAAWLYYTATLTKFYSAWGGRSEGGDVCRASYVMWRRKKAIVRDTVYSWGRSVRKKLDEMVAAAFLGRLQVERAAIKASQDKARRVIVTSCWQAWQVALCRGVQARADRELADAHYRGCILQRFLGLVCRGCHESARRRDDMKLRVSAAAEPLQMGAKRRLVLAWQDVHAACVLRKLDLARGAGLYATALFRRTLACLRARLQYIRAKRHGQRASEKHYRAALTSRILYAWTDTLKGETARRRRVAAALRLWRDTTARSVVVAWTEYVAGRREKMTRQQDALHVCRLHLLREGSRRWIRAGTEALRWRQGLALEDYSQRQSHVFSRVARIATHWLALTRARRTQRLQGGAFVVIGGRVERSGEGGTWRDASACDRASRTARWGQIDAASAWVSLHDLPTRHVRDGAGARLHRDGQEPRPWSSPKGLSLASALLPRQQWDAGRSAIYSDVSGIRCEGVGQITRQGAKGNQDLNMSPMAIKARPPPRRPALACLDLSLDAASHKPTQIAAQEVAPSRTSPCLDAQENAESKAVIAKGESVSQYKGRNTGKAQTICGSLSQAYMGPSQNLERRGSHQPDAAAANVSGPSSSSIPLLAAQLQPFHALHVSTMGVELETGKLKEEQAVPFAQGVEERLEQLRARQTALLRSCPPSDALRAVPSSVDILSSPNASDEESQSSVQIIEAEEFSGMDVDTMTQDQIESVLSAFAAQRQQHTHRMNEYVALAGP